MASKITRSKSQNIPKLRFGGFSGAWEERKLGDVFTKIRNGFVGIATPHYVSIGVPYLQGKNIKDGKFILDGLMHISSEFHEKQKNSQLKIGDILMVQSGHVGECAVVDSRFLSGNCHALLVMTPRIESVEPYFIKNIFYSETGNKIITRITTGNTIQHVLSSDVSKIKIKLPTLSEQQKIAEFLGGVDAWIENLRGQKENLESYKKGMMQKIFSQEIRFRDNDGKNFPKWGEKKLKEIVTFGRGSSLSKSDLEADGKYECIHYGELFTEYNEVITYIKSRTNLDTNVDGNMGDILMPTSDVTPQGLAKASSLQVDAVKLGGDINILRPNFGTDSIFLSYLLNFEKKKIMRIVSGSTVRHVYSKDLGGLKYSIPTDKDEQQKIAVFLGSIDKVLESKQQQITQAEQWKEGLMQGLFV